MVGTVPLSIIRSSSLYTQQWYMSYRLFEAVPPNNQAGGPPLVGCPRLLIKYIRGYPRYMRPFLPTPKQEDHPLSAVRDCLLNIFAATLAIWGRSSIRNLRTRHVVEIGSHLSRTPSWLTKD